MFKFLKEIKKSFILIASDDSIALLLLDQCTNCVFVYKRKQKKLCLESGTYFEPGFNPKTGCLTDEIKYDQMKNNMS